MSKCDSVAPGRAVFRQVLRPRNRLLAPYGLRWPYQNAEQGVPMRKLLLGIVAGATLTGAPALAADMPVYKAAPIVAVYNWSGFYTASTFGIGWTREYGDFVLPPPDRHNSFRTS